MPYMNEPLKPLLEALREVSEALQEVDARNPALTEARRLLKQYRWCFWFRVVEYPRPIDEDYKDNVANDRQAVRRPDYQAPKPK
jgi:hypothetical protein